MRASGSEGVGQVCPAPIAPWRGPRTGAVGAATLDAASATSATQTPEMTRKSIFRWGRLKRSPATTAALHGAIDAANVEAVAALLASGADPNAQKGHGDSPLHRATERGCAEIVSALLEAGADPNALNLYGHTPLSCAFENGDDEVVVTLLEAGADPNVFDRYSDSSLLHRAARTGNVKILTTLLMVGADPDAEGPYSGLTPLHHAAGERQ